MAALFWVRWGALLGLALAVAGWDLRRRLIPNAVVAAGLGAGLVLAVLAGGPALVAAGLGAAVLGGPMVLLWLAGAAAGGQGLVGAGDAKAALALGALLGMPDALAGLFWGAAAGALLALAAVGRGLWRGRGPILAALRRDGGWGCLCAILADPVWGQGIPYGAALSAGAVVAALLVR